LVAVTTMAAAAEFRSEVATAGASSNFFWKPRVACSRLDQSTARHQYCARRLHHVGRPADVKDRPSGLRTGSPPFPPPQSIRPTVRRLLRSPRFRVRVPTVSQCAVVVRQQLPFPSSSETPLECRDGAGQGSEQCARCREACRGNRWPKQDRDDRCRMISQQS